MGVDGETEPSLGADFVAIGDGDLAHVVAEADEFCPLPVGPGARDTHPGADAILDILFRPVADDDFAPQPQTGVDEPGLAVAMGCLVQVHEVHVDGAPRQVAVELRVEVQEGFPELREAADPHFGGREGVHPKDQARALRRVVGVHAELPDFVGRFEHGLEDQRERQTPGGVERFHDFLGVFGDLPEDLRAVKVLAAGDEPNFSGMEFHKESRLAGLFLLEGDELFHDAGEIGALGHAPEGVV